MQWGKQGGSFAALALVMVLITSSSSSLLVVAQRASSSPLNGVFRTVGERPGQAVTILYASVSVDHMQYFAKTQPSRYFSRDNQVAVARRYGVVAESGAVRDLSGCRPPQGRPAGFRARSGSGKSAAVTISSTGAVRLVSRASKHGWSRKLHDELATPKTAKRSAVTRARRLGG